MENPKTLPELIKAMTEELEDNKREIMESQYPEDLIHEIADGWVPIYYGELAEMLYNDHTLSDVDDKGLIDTSYGKIDEFNVWTLISLAIYERLSDSANEWLRNEQEAKAFCPVSYAATL